MLQFPNRNRNNYLLDTAMYPKKIQTSVDLGWNTVTR